MYRHSFNERLVYIFIKQSVLARSRTYGMNLIHWKMNAFSTHKKHIMCSTALCEAVNEFSFSAAFLITSLAHSLSFNFYAEYRCVFVLFTPRAVVACVSVSVAWLFLLLI